MLSRGIQGKALRAFPGSFRIFPEFLPKVPAVLGVWPIKSLTCQILPRGGKDTIVLQRP